MATDDQGEAQSQEGVQFRAVGGRRSSQSIGKQIFADSVAAVSPELARRIETTKDWRKSYIDPVREIVATGTSSPKNALRIAADGLTSVREHLVFVRNDNDMPLSAAVTSGEGPLFRTGEVKGAGQRMAELSIPYRGATLRGDALLTQLDKWESSATLEPSAAEALRLVARNPEWLDLSDRHFALLGAASEMGPLEALSAWGANLVAVDLPRAQLWEHISETARRGTGRLFVPLRANSADVTEGGADLLSETPAIRSWLGTFDQPLTVGNYVYADGATFVRLSGAVDVLIEDLLRSRNGTSLAYMATPTDVFAVSREVVSGARKAAGDGSARRKLARAASGSKLFIPNYGQLISDEDGREWGICDCLVPIQGANYALSKAIQRWRAIVAIEEGVVTSANVAPASHTRSVVKNRMLAAAYRGAPGYGIEIFDSSTSRWLMAALLVHDLRTQASAPSHPFELFVQGAVHGGIWRFGYEPRSVLPLALLTGSLKRK